MKDIVSKKSIHTINASTESHYSSKLYLNDIIISEWVHFYWLSRSLPKLSSPWLLNCIGHRQQVCLVSLQMLHFRLALAVSMPVSLDSVVVAIVIDSPMEEDYSLGQDRRLYPCAPHFSHFFLQRASPLEGIRPSLGLLSCLLCMDGCTTTLLTCATITQADLLGTGLIGSSYAFLTQLTM